MAELYKRNCAVAFYFVAREPWHDWSSSSSSASSTFLLLSCSKPYDQATLLLPVKPPPIHFLRCLPVQEQSLPSLGRFLHIKHSSEDLATPESQHHFLESLMPDEFSERRRKGTRCSKILHSEFQMTSWIFWAFNKILLSGTLSQNSWNILAHKGAQ